VITPARAAIACAAGLFLLNAALIRELFRIEFLDQMGSIEGAYIGISRYMMENWRDLSWFPLWYGGIPFQNAYPPLLHAVVALAAGAGGGSAAWAHHAVTGVFYCLGAVAVFWLAYSLSGHWPRAVLTGLLYSALSPSAWLAPAIRRDVGGAFYPRRLQNLIQYGEGPHLASLALLALAAACVYRAMEKRRPPDYCLAACAIAAVALTNYLGLFGLVVMLACLLLSREFRPAEWIGVGAVGAAGYALAAPWIPPSTLLAVRTNAQWVAGAYRMGWPQFGMLAASALALAGVAVWLRRRRLPPDLRFWILSSLALCGLVLPAFWFGTYAMPQPERYHPEMEMALAGLAAAVVSRQRIAAAAAVALCVAGFAGVRQYARDHLYALDVTRTVEYRMARWLEENAPGERVFLPGSASFWLNAFGRQPQLGGGFDQGITNRILPAVTFQVYSGMNAEPREGEVAVALLRTLGVGLAGAGGADSREFYKPYRNPRKFEGLLPEVWREGGDAIYRVGRSPAALAYGMGAEDLPGSPPDVTQTRVLARHLAAQDDPAYPRAEAVWKRPGALAISANLARGQVLAVQVTYDPGWQARANGRAVPVRASNVGMIVLEPDCAGACTVELEYTGGLEMRLARLARLAAAVAGLAWTAVWISRRRRERRAGSLRA
jgi:hypothetical protein